MACMVLFLTAFFPLRAAQAADAVAPSFTLSTDILSQYIFRGAAQSVGSAVIQPSFTASWAGFSASVWGNLDTSRHSDNPLLALPPGQAGNAKWSETDFTVSYTRELCQNFSALIGNVYYGLQEPLSTFDQDEVFGGVGYNFPWFTATLTAYGEVTHDLGVWIELDLARSIPLDMLRKGAVLDLGANFGYYVITNTDVLALNLTGATGDYSHFHTCQLTADVKVPVTGSVTVSPKIGLWLPLTGAASDFLQANSLDRKSTHFYGGANLTWTF